MAADESVERTLTIRLRKLGDESKPWAGYWSAEAVRVWADELTDEEALGG